MATFNPSSLFGGALEHKHSEWAELANHDHVYVVQSVEKMSLLTGWDCDNHYKVIDETDVRHMMCSTTTALMIGTCLCMAVIEARVPIARCFAVLVIALHVLLLPTFFDFLRENRKPYSTARKMDRSRERCCTARTAISRFISFPRAERRRF